MARYFFHLHECGTVILDEDGVDRKDMDAVRETALLAAREVMCAEVKEGRLCLGCCIRVSDASGETVLTLPFREALTVSNYQD